MHVNRVGNLFSSLEEGVYKEARREIKKAVNTYLPSSSMGHFLIKKKDSFRRSSVGQAGGAWMAETPSEEGDGERL